MHPVLKNILAVFVGIIVGSVVNMALIMLGPSIIALPAGIDPMDAASLKDNMHLFESKHFIFPFLAHALGTLVGAIVAYKMAHNHKAKMAYVIGAFFILGGILNAINLGGPTWFNALDIIVAYFPMAYLGIQIAKPKAA